MGIYELVAAGFVIAAAFLAVLYRVMLFDESATTFSDRAIFQDPSGRIMGSARFSASNKFLKIKLRQLEDMGVQNGHMMQVVVNGFVCDTIVWPGIILKYRKSYNELKAEPGFAPGADIQVIKGDMVLFSSAFGSPPRPRINHIIK